MMISPDFIAASQTSPYIAMCLQRTPEDLARFMALQQQAIDEMTPDCRHHLKIRTLEDLKAHLDARMPIIAVYTAGGDYIAHALLAYPIHDDVVQHMAHYPFDNRHATTAVIQSLYVLPEHRGKTCTATWGNTHMDPASLIFDVAKDLASMHGHTHIMAKIAADNISSLKTFQKRGFTLHTTQQDTIGNYPAHYLICPLYAAPCLAAEPKNAVS